MNDKQRTYGQFKTPADVADLLLSFCLRRPTDRLLDPSCGQGAFLVRAAQMQTWLTTHGSTGNTLWGVELDPDAAALAQATLPEAEIINQDFFEIHSWEGPLFDAIIGNPPYTRAEWISRLVENVSPAHQLSIFDGGAGSAPPALPQEPAPTRHAVRDDIQRQVLSKRAGLHAHFFVHGTNFLREGGRFGFVVPNSWLDVAYGERLKQFLLDHYRIIALIESSVERWFDEAKINTCLVILERCSHADARAANRVRLIRLFQPLDKLIPYPEDDGQRLSHLERFVGRLLSAHDVKGAEIAVRVVGQSDLDAGEKWGVVLRAPSVYRVHFRDALLPPLYNWASVQRGFTTGANAFFYLNDDTIEKWGLEAEFRRPLLKSLRGVKRRRVSTDDCTLQVLTIEPSARLSGTATADYIRWGEEQGWHRRRTCAGRRPWYQLPEQFDAVLLLAKGIWDRHFAPVLDDSLLLDQQLYQVRLTEGVPVLAAAALLNSAWFSLQLELQGRINFGEGLLWLAAYELNEVRLPDPCYMTDEQLADLVDAYSPMLNKPVGRVKDEYADPAWQTFNATVFELMGFSVTEAAAVTGALLERVAARQAKARRG